MAFGSSLFLDVKGPLLLLQERRYFRVNLWFAAGEAAQSPAGFWFFSTQRLKFCNSLEPVDVLIMGNRWFLPHSRPQTVL